MDAKNVNSDLGRENYPTRKIPAFSTLHSGYLKATWVGKAALVMRFMAKNFYSFIYIYLRQESHLGLVVKAIG